MDQHVAKDIVKYSSFLKLMHLTVHVSKRMRPYFHVHIWLHFQVSTSTLARSLSPHPPSSPGDRTRLQMKVIEVGLGPSLLPPPPPLHCASRGSARYTYGSTDL